MLRRFWGLPLAVALLVQGTWAAPSAEKIGTIAKVMGDVKFKGANALTSVPAVNNQEVSPKDSLETGPRSFVKILMKDDTILQVGPSSKFTFDQFVMRTKEDRDTVYNLGKGQLRALFTVKAKKDDQMKIKTPNVSMGIRGTELLANVSTDTKGAPQSQLLVLEGKIGVNVKANTGVELKLDLPQGLVWNSAKLDPNKLNESLDKIPAANLAVLQKNPEAFLPQKIDTLQKEGAKSLDILKDAAPQNPQGAAGAPGAPTTEAPAAANRDTAGKTTTTGANAPAPGKIELPTQGSAAQPPLPKLHPMPNPSQQIQRDNQQQRDRPKPPRPKCVAGTANCGGW